MARGLRRGGRHTYAGKTTIIDANFGEQAGNVLPSGWAAALRLWCNSLIHARARAHRDIGAPPKSEPSPDKKRRSEIEAPLGIIAL